MRIDGLRALAHLEIEFGASLSAGIADGGDDIARRDPVAHRFEDLFRVAVEAQVPAAVLENEQQSEPREPVGVNDTAVVQRAHLRSTGSAEEHAVPVDSR